MTNAATQAGPTHAQPGHWRSLAEIGLPDLDASVPVALTEITQALQASGVGAADQERLQRALRAAVAQAGAQNRQPQPASAALVRLLVAQRLLGKEGPDLSRDHLSGRSPAPGGWGFFLVERSGDELANADPAAQSVIELFLYQEGNV